MRQIKVCRTSVLKYKLLFCFMNIIYHLVRALDRCFSFRTTHLCRERFDSPICERPFSLTFWCSVSSIHLIREMEMPSDLKKKTTLSLHFYSSSSAFVLLRIFFKRWDLTRKKRSREKCPSRNLWRRSKDKTTCSHRRHSLRTQKCVSIDLKSQSFRELH